MASTSVIGLIILILSSASNGMMILCNYQVHFYGYSPTSNQGQNLYSCIVTAMSFENPTVVEQIIGNHTVGMNDSDVRGFNVQTCRQWGHCPYSIPKNIGKFFPNLNLVSWIVSSLETITSDALETIPNLISLEVAGNSIKLLDNDLFKYTPKICYFDATKNAIRQIGNDTFAGLKDLVTVSLRGNACVDKTFAFKEVSTIELHSSSSPYPYPYVCPTTAESTTVPPTMVTASTAPPTASYEEQCLARCSLNEEVDKLREQVDSLVLFNAKLDERLVCQHLRIATLEKQLGIYQ